MSSRNNNYERLEGGMGPVRPGAGKKLQWKKLAMACTTLIALVWFLSPRGDGGDGLLPDDVYPSYTTTGPHQNIHTANPPSPSKFPALPSTSDPQTVPTSPETDPDPLKTVHCAMPHSSTSSLVQYALMIDAGSTGSRIHIYKFHNCGPSPAYEYEVFKQIQPGLSSYAGQPRAAAESLDVLLDEALRVVPASLHSCTPVSVKATAGLRLLGAQQSIAILDAVEEHLLSAYPFILPDRDAVAIMDGRDEGVYAWITANYLLDTIRVDSPTGAAPYAVLDLGGGSTQIVFEPERAEKEVVGLKDGEHKYELVFGGTTRMLYQHSYLGYGLKSARGSVHRLVEFIDSVRKSHADIDEEHIPRIPNPCLAQGTTKEVEIPQVNGEKKLVLMAGEDVGSFDACKRVLELVMAKDAVCELKPCSFDGVYQPSLLDAFPTGKILLLSYFYDRITPLIGSTDHSNSGLMISTISQLAKQVCAGTASWKEYWGSDPAAMEELEGRPEWCLDLSFMHALLVLGYEFSEARGVELGKKIGGTELGWCLGATIAMVSGGEVHCQA